MRVAVIAGAGATVAEALPSQPPLNEIPPLDNTFFRLCKKRNIEGLPSITKYLDQHYGIQLDSTEYGEYGMEDVFNIIYSDALSGDGPTESLDAYRRLLNMYRQAIRATTDGLEGRSRNGVGGLLRFLNREATDIQIDFITFNHDLVIENAIHSALDTKRYNHIPFSVETAYEVDFEDFLTRSTAQQLNANVNRRPSYRLLKLHGSLNWVFAVKDAEDAKSVLKDPGDELYCIKDRTIGLQIRLSKGGESRDLLPLVVPPVYEKSGEVRNVLQPVWSAARGAIERADEIIVFGYSVPDADIAARNMLRRAFHANKHADRVSIIDISPEVASKIGAWINCPAFSFYRSVKDFTRMWPYAA